MPFLGRWQDMPTDLDDLEDRIIHGFTEGFDQGETHAVKSTRRAVLDYLETKYLRRDVERGTPEAQAILQVAADLAREFDRPDGEFTVAAIKEKGKRKP